MDVLGFEALHLFTHLNVTGMNIVSLDSIMSELYSQELRSS